MTQALPWDGEGRPATPEPSSGCVSRAMIPHGKWGRTRKKPPVSALACAVGLRFRDGQRWAAGPRLTLASDAAAVAFGQYGTFNNCSEWRAGEFTLVKGGTVAQLYSLAWD